MKKTGTASILIAILFCMLITLCSCSMLSGNAPDYDSNVLISELEDTLYRGKTVYTAEYSTSSLSSADIQADLDDAIRNNYVLSCMLENISVSVDKKFLRTEMVFQLSCKENARGCGRIMDVSGEAQLRDALEEIMRRNAVKTPLLISNWELSEEVLSDMLNEADINCDESAYEYKNIYYVFYKEMDGQRMMIVWGDSPADDAENIQKKAELALVVEQCVAEVKATQPADNAATYEAIYDTVCRMASYDDHLADISASDPKALTKEMLRDRTAYGALITGSTVCSGYSKAFKNICEQMGLPCYIVTGDCGGMRHAWNAVPMDGEILYIDCTSGDEGGFGKGLFLFTEWQAQSLGYTKDDSCHIPF